MSSELAAASIAGAAFLIDGPIPRLLRLISVEGDEARVAGGAVRDALLGLTGADVDVATTARPEVVIARATAAGLRAVPTGIEHGTVTVVDGGVGVEVTTLREDVETHGRHATVRFGRDWRADAERRDFTINGLFADAEGRVHDLVGGVADLALGRVRFIGEPSRRIAEDFLRVLRFFRFHASYGAGPPDPAGLGAAVEARHGLDILSVERIAKEMRRLVVAPRAPETLALMAETRIAATLGLSPDPALFARLHALVGPARGRAFGAGDGADAALLIAGLARSAADAADLAERLKLSNAERERIAAAWAHHSVFAEPAEAAATRAAAYRLGSATARDAALLAHAASDAALDDPARLAVTATLSAFVPPRLPVAGRDFLAAGLSPGPEVGRALARAEAAFVASGFTLTTAELVTIGLAS